ncbi:MAG: MarR family winged helix-turn-helix transcriptional regulator [Candidatus Methanofastidiosia archaeon]
MDDVTKRKVFDIFGNMFFLTHRLEYIVDKELKKDNLTAKQWQVIGIIENLFEYPPAINEVADKLSTTHQNVKQIANQLERKGFITIKRDEKDKRILRLKTTEKNRRYWDLKAEEHGKIVLSLFDSLGKEEINRFYALVEKLSANINKIYEKSKEM